VTDLPPVEIVETVDTAALTRITVAGPRWPDDHIFRK
jgi:hypothetical protein